MVDSACLPPLGPASIFVVFPILCDNLSQVLCLKYFFSGLSLLVSLKQGSKRMPGTAVTKSVVANEPGGRKREEIFVDIIEKISVTFSSSVSISCYFFTSSDILLCYLQLS